uniref:Potassium channel domain-containing protein n=1 Tax=Chromera velia CCMP2878 TaxID=1169474 RepID=A0A0G4HL49_9ALVE|eukprot:Cvel_7299.t1-p1 / transcript=Cvel_7299.t1 / gene=Cvel_7299 / organism=Chromera_velia_CCMP2878 / gene_product=hypothetical protein / transcript_product=hypothetical protein / location=Cvel_scaffold377:77089-80745(-) / protein_length=684 / sequence_SO=supercontig / SO=protein_coding / is_pseudo=false
METESASRPGPSRPMEGQEQDAEKQQAEGVPGAQSEGSEGASEWLKWRLPKLIEDRRGDVHRVSVAVYSDVARREVIRELFPILGIGVSDREKLKHPEFEPILMQLNLLDKRLKWNDSIGFLLVLCQLVFMIADAEVFFRRENKDDPESEYNTMKEPTNVILRSLIWALSVGIFFFLYIHYDILYCQAQLQLGIPNKFFIYKRFLGPFLIECIIHCLQPLPGYDVRVNGVQGWEFHISAFLSMLFLARTYWFLRIFIRYSMLSSAETRKLKYNSESFIIWTHGKHKAWVMKATLQKHPMKSLVVLLVFSMFLGSFALVMAERQLGTGTDTLANYANAIWNTLITMTTVGYGDFAAKSGPGRFAALSLHTIGEIFEAFFLVGLGSLLRPTRIEAKVMKEVRRKKLEKARFREAACAFQKAWILSKIRRRQKALKEAEGGDTSSTLSSRLARQKRNLELDIAHHRRKIRTLNELWGTMDHQEGDDRNDPSVLFHRLRDQLMEPMRKKITRRTVLLSHLAATLLRVESLLATAKGPATREALTDMLEVVGRRLEAMRMSAGDPATASPQQGAASSRAEGGGQFDRRRMEEEEEESLEDEPWAGRGRGGSRARRSGDSEAGPPRDHERARGASTGLEKGKREGKREGKGKEGLRGQMRDVEGRPKREERDRVLPIENQRGLSLSQGVC